MNIKRTVAKILAVVMFFTSLQNVSLSSLQAANITTAQAYDFQVLRQALSESNPGLEIAERGTSDYDTALAQWDVSANGEYILTYYTVVNGVTKRIETTFTNNGQEIEMVGKIYSAGSTVSDTLNYTQRVFDTDRWINLAETTGQDAFSYNFIVGTSPRENKEFSVTINNLVVNNKNLVIRVKLDSTGKTLQFYTNGIDKGYMNKFTLDNTSTTGIDATQEFFNGPKNFTITPVHLKDSTSFDSMDTITADDLNTISPGSKPGIKVSFDPIKTINANGEFALPATADAPKVQIRLKPQYSTSSTGTTGDGSISLRFNTVSGATITKEDETTVLGTLVQSDSSDPNSAFNIYLANPLDGTTFRSEVVNWDELTSSMVLVSTFSLQNESTVYSPDNKGYTYLKYSVSKANDNQVKFTIEPYNINSTATYTISTSTWGTSDSFTDAVIYEYDPSKTNNQEITATVDNTGTNYYRIDVTIDGQLYRSQVIQYIPENFIAQPSITAIKTVENIYVVPNDNDTSNNAYPLAIGFDMKWTAPDNLRSLLGNGKLYYELMLRESKDDQDPINSPALGGTDGYAAYSKVFGVSLDAEDNVIVESVLGTAGQKDATDEAEAKLKRYDKTNNVFSMENISLMNLGANNNNWEQITFDPSYSYINSRDYLVGASVGDTLVDKVIPGTYYLSLRTVYVPNDTGMNFTYSTESNLHAVSLDLVREVVPVPTSITTTDVTTNTDKITEQIKFDYVDIQSYVKKMLEPAELYLYTTNKAERYSGEYVLYLYNKDGALTTANVDSVTPIDVSLDDTIDLSQITIGDKSALKVLRDGGVVALKVKMSSLVGTGGGTLKLTGLDSNQVYYLQARTKLSPFSNGSSVEPRYSLLSKVFTFTTTTQPVPPNADDKKPTAPGEIKIAEEGVTKNSVTLEWTPADFEEDSDVYKTYYEFIRTDKQLTETEKSQTVEALVGANSKWVGFSSFNPNSTNYNDTDYMMTYTSKTSSWTALSPAQLSSNFKLFDDTLSPNQIYYYYVRTVCIINGSAVKSGWIMVPVTTSQISKPENLKVELSKTYSYNAKTETVISFDAPIPDGASVPGDFEFEIAVQGADDTDYSLDYSTPLVTSTKEHEGTPDGYTHFVYKITGLKPNSRYYIKVRIKDKTQDISDGSSYPTSSYCDPVSTRTEYDEDYEEEQEKYEEYIKKFEQEVEKISTRDYWVVEEGVGYKYRNDYMNAKASLSSQYDLVVENDEEAYYYIPAESFMEASENKTTLNITIGDYSASIRPYTLTEENDDIEEVLEQIANNKIEDYYVKVSFSLNKMTGTIGGQSVLTPRMTIEMEIVYLKEDEDEIESEILESLDSLVKDQKKDMIKDLKKEVDKGNIDDDDLAEIIDDAISELETDLAKKVNKIIKNRTKKTEFVNTIDKAILLVAKSEAYAADGYYLVSDWTSVEVYSAMGGFAIEATKLGTYVMTGQASLIDTVPSLAPYQSFIAKYNLTDFFKLDGYMIQTAVTKDQLYGAVARVLGAPRGTDYPTYLKSKNIKGVSTLITNQAVRQDESIYIIMQVYEKTHNRPVETISIKNRQSVQNIGAFQPVYRNYVYAAVELKIVEPVNGRVMPSKQMTVEEIIKILYNAQAR